MVAALAEWMNEQRPTVICHLGKQTGNIGRRLARVPGFGRRLDHNLHQRAVKAQSSGSPGSVAALVMYALSMRRVRRFRRMLRKRSQGIAVVADRFPQLAVPGPMDGLGLASAAQGNWLARLLSRRERAHYEGMVAHRPDLVIRLNVGLDTALVRKPDHRASSLARKIADVPRLRFEGAPIVEIDAELALTDVIAQALRAVLAILELPARQ